VIEQYGGEVEERYQPRVTHLLCKTQDSTVAAQALREGKRLVTRCRFDESPVSAEKFLYRNFM
jgi:hypothetical protein